MQLSQLIANGASGANGISAQNHVEAGCMADVEILQLRKGTEEKFVSEDQLKWNRATCSLAKVNFIFIQIEIYLQSLENFSCYDMKYA